MRVEKVPRFPAINSGAFMQRRLRRINEKGVREKDTDGLSYFRHVPIVAFNFSTNPEARKGARGGKDAEEIGNREAENFGCVSRCIGLIFVAEVTSGIRMARRRVSRSSSTFEKLAFVTVPAARTVGE